MEKLPLETQTLYAEMLERLSAMEAHRSVGHLSGSFTALAEERPGDLQLGWETLQQRGRGWTSRARKGLAAMKKYSEKNHSKIAAFLK